MPLAFSIYYTDEEKKLLEEICKVKEVPFSAIEQLIEEEFNFHGMGRRIGLSSAIRRIIEEATEKRLREVKE